MNVWENCEIYVFYFSSTPNVKYERLKKNAYQQMPFFMYSVIQ